MVYDTVSDTGHIWWSEPEKNFRGLKYDNIMETISNPHIYNPRLNLNIDNNIISFSHFQAIRVNISKCQ